jgi:site-specific DNA recombinase
MKAAAIYARVSSEQQKEENTIASQTAALIEFAREQGYSVPDEWVIEDEGFSGASLQRPGLERLRDLAAEGHIQAVLIHSPDRLSRKYAYQVLLTEEFARQGVETVFLKAPHSGTPEDQLMLQFQGMIAEYERAQILERSRRGKRHRAKAGEVSVLCGAPYGYRYIRKTSDTPARYEIDAAEAEVVRLVYDKYTVDGLSIGAIARLLRELGLPTRQRVTRWERSVIWAILRNPAYQGTACFNKTGIGPRQKVTRPFRLSGRAVHGEKSSGHERPRDEWIEIPVPAIVSEETFALAAERLADNKRFAPRRTIEPSIVQGLVSCHKCGYALSRTSTRSSARKIHYYRCLGSDAWRHLRGPVCDSRPIRQDLLDQIVWQEVIRLIEDPTLVQAELDRRLDAARAAEPTRRRQDALERELARVSKSMERLITAYQEDLLSLDELRRRMPELRAREQSMRSELQAILDQAADRMSFLRLAETLTAFLKRLHESAESLEITERQKVVRLLVKDVLVDDDTITIRHSIPSLPRTPPTRTEPPPDGKSRTDDQSYLLRSRSERSALRRAFLRRADKTSFQHTRAQKAADQLQEALVGDPLSDEPHQDIVVDPVKEFFQVKIHHDGVSGRDIRLRPLHRLMRRVLRSEAEARLGECRVPICLQHLHHRLLNEAVEHRWNAERPLAARRLRYLDTPHRLRLIGAVK